MLDGIYPQLKEGEVLMKTKNLSRTMRAISLLAGFALVMPLSGCLSQMSKGEGGIMSAGSKAEQAQPPARCPQNYGTARVKPRSDQTGTSMQMIFSARGGTVNYDAQSALDSLVESFATESGCFTVLARGGALDAIREEQAIQEQNTNTKKRLSKGTVKAAQYVILVDILMNSQTGGGMGGLGGLLPGYAGIIAGAVTVNNAEASVRINIADVSTGEIVIDVTGDSKSTDIGFGGLGIGGGIAAAGGAWGSTPAAKRTAAAYDVAWRKAVALMPSKLVASR